MSFSLQCPACGASYELDESYLGQKVQCAECKEKFLIESGEGRIVARRESEPVEPVPAETQVAAEWKDGDVILDLYEVKQTHEGGGMGLVYRVHHRGWNMDLAVKSPRVGWFQTEEQKENFTRECEAWINLGLHPHIVSCYYVRTLGGIPRVFAEYVEGGSLKDWIDSRRLYEGGPQAALARILDIAIQFAWGLQYAHEQGLVHQDVKPANVLMTLDGTAKVSDFGLAKARVAAGEHFIAEGERSILVSTGGMTPAYCSPEQARGLPVSRRTDVWSWAVSVLEMFVGEVCWQSGLAAPEVLANLAEMRLKSAGIPEPSGTIVALLRLCLAEDPGKRPENFRVLVALFKATWRTLTGHEYVRDRPVPAKLHASVLNNQAVSLLDLGRFEDALSLFDEALGLDPGHPHVIYNRGLHLWRNSGLTDDRIVSALKESGLSRTDDWNLRYLLGWIHSERGDFESAVENFSSALGMRGPKAEILRALAEARARTNCALSEHNALEESFSVFSVALSVDGRWALLANLDCSLRLWDIRSGRCIQTLRGHESPAFSLTFSMDRRMAVSGSGDGTVRLWDLERGCCVKTLEVGEVLSVSLSEDGRFALSGSSDGTVRIWDVNKGRCLNKFGGKSQPVFSVALSADGKTAMSGGVGSICVWDVAGSKLLRMLDGHALPVRSVAMSGDGLWAVSGSDDKTLRIWNLAIGQCVRVFEGHDGGVGSVALSTDGCWALSGGECILGFEDRTVRLWDINGGRCLRTFDGHAGGEFPGRGIVVALSGDGRWGISASDSAANLNHVKVMDLRALYDQNRAVKAPAVVCRFAEAGQLLMIQEQFQLRLREAHDALARNDPGLAWRLATQARKLEGHEFSEPALKLAHRVGLVGRRTALRSGRFVKSFQGHTGSVSAVAISADGRCAVSGAGSGMGDADLMFRLWDVKTGKCLRTFEGHSEGITSLVLSRGGEWVLSGSMDGSARLWKVADGKCLRTFQRGDSVSAVALSVDLRLALSGTDKGSLHLWHVNSSCCLNYLEGHTDWISSVSLSVDGRWALSGSWDRTLRLWELASGRCLMVFEGHTSTVTSLALSPQGLWALSGSCDKTMRLWDLKSGQCIRIFNADTRSVNSVALSADGRWGLSGGLDKTVSVWNLVSGTCARAFEGHLHEVGAVAFSLDGRWALSGSYDKTVRMWELEWEYEFLDGREWDDGARSCLETFLALHCPVGQEDGFTRTGQPIWNEKQFALLLRDLQFQGYGWLQPDGVRRQLEKMTAEWQGPPPIPGQQDIDP